jgi:hypothetical protein
MGNSTAESEIVLKLRLTREAQAKLTQRAADSGRDVAEYAAGLLESAVSALTLDELLAPFRHEVSAEGTTDEQLDSFYEELRNEAWRDQHHRKT